MKVETQTGKGSINSTHMVAFQELSQMSVITEKKVELERTKRRTLEKSETEARNVSIDPKKEPPCILDSVYPQETNFDAFPEETEYLMWIIFRKLNAANQIFPSSAAWKTQVRTSDSSDPVQKTIVMYLQAIPSKVTDFNTIEQYLMCMKKLAEEVNMPFVNVTLDVGAAMNAYKLCWNYPERFKNVLIHVGDLHFLKKIPM